MGKITKPVAGGGTFDWDEDAATPFRTDHESVDHEGLPGVPAEEAFTKAVHDLEDHSSIPGVPDVTGLLDETAHDELDHTGLTGVPSIEGLLDETAHDELDHTGLTGIPDITGLLDETAHDALDHTGLTGIPAATQFKDNIALDDSLPQNEILDVLGNDLGADNASTSGGKFAYADSWLAVPFILAGATDSLTLYIKHGGATAAGSNARAKIFSDNAGVPGVELFSDNITIVNDSIKDGPYILSHSLNAGNYWLVLMVTTSSSFTVYSFAKTGKNLYKSINGGTSWTLDASNLSITVSLTSLVLNGYEDGDIVFTEDTNKLHRWDDGTSSWIELNPDETFTGSDHSTTDHTGLTGVGSQQWREPVADAASLPGVLGVYDTTGTKNAAGFSDNYNSTYHAASFPGNGEGNYQAVSEWAYDSSSITLRGYIYTDNAGKPGTIVATSDADHVGTVAAGQQITFNFTGVNLTQSTTYWYVAQRISGATANMEKRTTENVSTDGARGTNGTTWTNCGPMWVQFLFTGGTANVPGDAVVQKDINQIKVWDGSAWVAVAPTTNNTAVDDVEESATPTSVELKLNELLDVLRTSGIIAS